MPRLSRAAPNTSAAHGMAALTVVMVLFFVMAMVAAYTNRSLIFEQRISANNYRATSAMNASEAGIEWGIAMINGGRVDDNCLGSSNTAHASFRERYLTLQSDGSYQTTKWPPVGAQKVFSPSCVLTSAGWNCSCPATGEPTLAYQAPPAPVFRVQFDTSVSPTLASGPGVIILKSRGCSNISNASTASSDPNQVDSCHRASGVTPNVDGLSDLRVALGLARALPVPPPAALTVGRNVSVAGAGALSAVNTDASTALTVHAGTALPVTGVTPIGPAGSDAAASTNSV